jgi:hypothetical protein
VDFDPEFVVASPHVLHEGVAAHDHTCGVVAFEAAHRTEPGLEPLRSIRLEVATYIPPMQLLACGDITELTVNGKGVDYTVASTRTDDAEQLVRPTLSSR